MFWYEGGVWRGRGGEGAGESQLSFSFRYYTCFVFMLGFFFCKQVLNFFFFLISIIFWTNRPVSEGNQCANFHKLTAFNSVNYVFHASTEAKQYINLYHVSMYKKKLI